MKTVIVKVNNATQTIAEHTVVTQDGKPTVIKAVQKVNYELFDIATGKAPQHIITKRVGKDLHVTVDGQGQERDLIIEGFYNDPDCALIGLAEDGSYYYYVPDSGELEDFVTELAFGDIEGQALGGQAQPNPWWVGASESDGTFAWLPWLAGLAGVATIAVATGGNSNSNDYKLSKDTTPLDAPKVDSVTNVDNDGDGTPDETVISGTTEPGAEVIVKDKDGNVIGEGKADEEGNYEVTVPALDKDEVVEVTATDEASNESDPTEVVGTGDDIAPNNNTTTITIDDVTEDNVINAQEVANNVAVTGMVTGEFTKGDWVTLVINARDYKVQVDVNGKFSIKVSGSDLANDADKTIDGFVAATDVAGNTGTITTIKEYAVDLAVPGDDDGDGVSDNAPVVSFPEDTTGAEGKPDGLLGLAEDGEPKLSTPVRVELLDDTVVGDIVVVTINDKATDVKVEQDNLDAGFIEVAVALDTTGDGKADVTQITANAFIKDAAGNQSLTSDDAVLTIDFEAPTIDPQTVEYDENQAANSNQKSVVVGEVIASDDRGNISYSITKGNDNAYFDINEKGQIVLT